VEIPDLDRALGPAADGEPHPVTLVGAWWRAAGAGLARVASPLGIHEGRLQLRVPDECWRKEILAHQDEILARLRRQPGCQAVRGIDLSVEP
jgi:Dna[CI] antecedent DciA-like protein